MAFQKSWGWKGMAARLLLVPVLAGSAGTVAAQAPTGFGSSNTGTVGAAVANTEKARGLLAQAKKALDAGDAASAEALAKQAADLNPSLSYSETRPETILSSIAARPARAAAPVPNRTQPVAARTPAAPRTPPAQPAPTAAATAADPKELMRIGQQALAQGRLDQAQDFAAQANQAAAARGYKWGLFEDTPNGLMKDIQEARAKSDKTQSADLFKKAKALAAAPAKTDAERMQNLDQALNMAYQAKNLHGPYSLWDFGDKPDDLIRNIESAKAVARKTGTPQPAAGTAMAKKGNPIIPGVMTAGGKTPTNTPVQQAGGVGQWNDKGVQPAVAKLPPPTLTPTMPAVTPQTMPAPVATAKAPETPAPAPSLTLAPPAAPQVALVPPALTAPDLKMPAMPAVAAPSMPAPLTVADPAKAQIAKLVSDGRSLLTSGKVLEARQKADEARKLLADKPLLNFATGEDTPDELFQAAQAKGNQMIQSLTAKADECLAKNGSADAQAALDEADKLAAGLGLYAKSIADRKAKLTGTPVAVAPPAIVAPTVPTGPIPGEYLVPVESVPASALPMGLAIAPPAPVQATGNTLLAQAEAELKRGEHDMARRIAMQAFNADPAAKGDAQALLRSIDAADTEVKRKEADAALKSAADAHAGKQFETALGIAKRIDPAYLSAEQKESVKGMMLDCLAMTEQPGELVQAQATETKPAKPTTAADEQRAMADVAFQKLRQDGLDAMTAAANAWGRGETDAAIRMLEEYEARVKASGQPAGRQANLLGGIENRLRGYAALKHNVDVLAKEANEKRELRQEMLGGRLAEVQKQEEIKKKVAEVNNLIKAKKFKEAEALALQVKQLDPDNPALTAIHTMAKISRRKEDADKLRDGQEGLFLEAMNGAERQGPYVDTDNPVAVNPEAMRRAALRGDAALYQRARTPEEFRIERELSTPYSLSAGGESLRDVLKKVRTDRHLNMVTDDVALDDEKISLDQITITEELKDLPLRDVLTILLQKARMAYVVENNVVKLTTEKRSKGRLTTKVFHVMDLVTPIPEFGLSPHHTLAGAIAETKRLPQLAPQGGGANGPTPFTGRNDLGGAQLVSGGTPGAPGMTGGSLQNNLQNSQSAMMPQREVYARQLKKLITGMVRPMTWQDSAGAGNIEYYDIGGAMVVNQTADVINEVDQLLNSLRRLQDLSVAVEIRVISLSEAFFERVGVDFNLNVKTNNTSFERQLATSQFRPEPFLNDINVNGATVGYSPATGFTSDLDVPIRATSYALSQPPFGGYSNALSPTLNGGLSLGLAFLNDIQVYMFLEAAQGNRRVNIMQAPKITLFNGQTSTVFVGDVAFFTTSLQVFNVGGQFVYLPQNVSFPIGNGFDPNGQGQQGGVSVTVQAIISSDRRFVRLNLSPTLTALASATVPLFPITTFVTPVFEGGSQGQPIPFTQFFQQPAFTEISAQTTVAVPDGGTVLLGGLKTLAQGRNEFGPPVLAQVPYLNRLFKNVGIGQETRHVMLMVTPRIIINSEEEVRQTGEGIGGLLPQN